MMRDEDEMSVQIGPFFYMESKLICNTCPLDKGRRQADKLDNSYSHEQLWDDYFDTGDFIDHPRGRVVWDCTNNCAIVYIDRCINTPTVLSKIKEAFDLQDCAVEFDDHYRCRNCISDLDLK